MTRLPNLVVAESIEAILEPSNLSLDRCSDRCLAHIENGDFVAVALPDFRFKSNLIGVKNCIR